MKKTTNLKKEVFRILVILIIFLAYSYQKPMFTTEKATGYAGLCLENPPKRLGIKAVHLNWPDIKPEKFSIVTKSGFFNQLTNQREFDVTLKTKDGEELTVRMDAYDGRCLEVTGPLK